MTITKDVLLKRKTELQGTFEKLQERIKSTDVEVGAMRSNLNATAGAIQQIDLFLKDFEGEEDVSKSKTMPKEKQEALNIATT